MKIALLQTDIVWNSPQENVRGAQQMMDEIGAANLYVLPEMFSTGFATEPKGIAEPVNSDTLRWMVRLAKERNAAVAGSIAVEESDSDAKNTRYYNRFYFVHPDGKVEHYDKHHLFTYGGEHLRFTPGNERVVVEHMGVRILLQVCYDLRFPVFARNTAKHPYDLALYVASWPTSRIEAWNTLLKARAIENQCYVAAVNRVGEDPACKYSGGTAFIDPYGHVVERCEDGRAQFITARVDMDALKAFREKFPVLKDADNL
jgi:predicted amidohydrolase